MYLVLCNPLKDRFPYGKIQIFWCQGCNGFRTSFNGLQVTSQMSLFMTLFMCSRVWWRNTQLKLSEVFTASPAPQTPNFPQGFWSWNTSVLQKRNPYRQRILAIQETHPKQLPPSVLFSKDQFLCFLESIWRDPYRYSKILQSVKNIFRMKCIDAVNNLILQLERT